MRNVSPPLYPKQRRKARQAEAFGAGASFDPSKAKAEASLFYQKQGGKFARPKSGTSKLPPKFIKG